MKINETSNNSFQNKVLIDTFIEQISALQTDVGDLQIADDNLAQALATKANTADISNEVGTGTLNATNGNIKTLKVQGPGSEATLENATISEATIGTENVTQSNITNLEVMDVDAGTVRAGTIVVENDATISGNLAVQDIGAKDITSASVNTLNLTAAEADVNKLEAQNAEVTGKLEVNDLEVSGNFTGVSNIESESIESESITSDNADIETLNVKNIRDWVSQIMNQEQMLTPSPQLGNVDRYTIELPSFNGVFLLSWEDSDVLWSATVIGNGKSYGISWGSKTEENYITDLFQYNGKLYIRINCNGKLKYAYSATKELSPITIYFNMDGWTKEESLEELCDEQSHIENAYPTGTAWLGPVFIPRLVEGESSGSGINFRGSCKFAEIPSFNDTLAGDVWNITDEAYTDNRFVEGAGKPINAGDDIIAVIVKEEDEDPIMKWDKFNAGVNYENFIAKNITADKITTPDLEVTGNASVSGSLTINNNNVLTEANIVDTVADENMNAITSNAVYNDVVKYETTDTFTIAFSLPNVSVNRTCVFNNKIYVGTNSNGIYESSDGVTFTQNTSFPTNYGIRGRFFVFSGKMYVGTNGHGLYVSSDGVTFTHNTSIPSSSTVQPGGTYNGKIYVGVNSSGIYESSDGVTFTQNTSFPTTHTATTFIEYNNNFYVITGGFQSAMNKGIYVSSDGVTFTQNTSFPTNYGSYSAVVYNNKLYIGTIQHGLYESSDGVTFTQNTSFPTAQSMQLLTVYNNWLYIGTNISFYKTNDGITFVEIRNGFGTGYQAVEKNGLLYVPADSRGLIVNSINQSTFMDVLFQLFATKEYVEMASATSSIPPTVVPDSEMSDTSDNPVENKVIKKYVDGLISAAFGRELGKVWHQGTGANTNYSMYTAVYANGLWICGSDSHGIWWSEDGKNWTQGTGNNTTYTINAVAYANGLWVSGSMNNGAWWSEDGKNWTQGTGANTAYTINAIVYANDIWIGGSLSGGIWWSEDGKSWTRGAGNNTNYSMRRINYANGLWVSGSTSHGLWWSTNGKNWTQGTGANTTYTTNVLVHANGLWVSGSTNHGIWWSDDGKSWTQGTGANTTYTINAIVYANGLWVSGSSGHGMWWSTNGKNWTQGTGTEALTSTAMQYLIYANGLWVCGSNNSGIWWSEDGKNWTQGTGGNTTYPMQYLVYANGLWICGSDSHGIWWSEDGKNWNQGTGANTNYSIQSLVYANGLWVSGSNGGMWHGRNLNDLIADGIITL